MRPTAFFVIGPAGSGKSTIARRIAAHHSAAYLDKDSLATGFTALLLTTHGYGADERDGNEFYRTAILPLEYDTMLGMCGDNLRVGQSVVLDAPFAAYLDDPEYLATARKEFAWPDAELVVVHVTTDPERQRERLIQRGYARDAWKLDNWAQYRVGSRTTRSTWADARHVTVDNSGVGVDDATLDSALPSGRPQAGALLAADSE